MKKHHKTLWKKLSYVFTLAFMGLALALGIVFSVLKVNTDLGYGISFNGGWQATIQVVHSNEQNQPTNEQIAQGLSDKLSGDDTPLTVSFIGKDHISVSIGKDRFESKEQLKNQIQSTGGLFILNRKGEEFGDLYTNADALTAVNGNVRINSTDLFDSTLGVASLAKTQGRAPYLHLGLTQDGGAFNFAKVIDAVGPKENDPEPSEFYFITDLQSLFTNIRDLYANIDLDQDEAIQAYWDNVIKPAQDYLEEVKDETIRDTLRDVFSGTVNWTVRGTGSTGFPRSNLISLLDQTFGNLQIVLSDNQGVQRRISGIRDFEDLKYILKYSDQFRSNENRGFDYFMYRPETTKEDFESDLYKEERVSSFNSNVRLGSIQDTFKIVTNFFLNEVILKTDEQTRALVLNETLTRMIPTIKDSIIFQGNIGNNTSTTVTIPNLTGPETGFTTVELENGTSNQLASGLYIPTQNNTVARQAVAAINQSTLGVTYQVESIVEIFPTITQGWLKISVAFLTIIAILLSLYLLFVYRLLGLFTIIIAVTTAGLMLVFATIFGISVGPQLIMALFLIIGLTIDLSLIIFNALSDRVYQDKHAFKTAFKIANKETIGLTIDSLIVALIPNVVMFWIAQGDLRNFATISTIGIFLVLIFGVLVLRLSTWLVLKLKVVQTNPMVLPIDTNFSLKLSFINQYLVHKYTAYLERHEGKEKYSSKELLKMKRTSEKLAALSQELDAKNLVNIEKLKLSDQKEVLKIERQIEKYTQRKETSAIRHWNFLGISQKFNNHYDLKIEQLNEILKAETFINVSETKEQSVAKKVRVLKTERTFNRAGVIVGLVVILLSILATIVGFTVGPNWSWEFGKGQQFVVYGQDINNSYDNTIGSQRPSGFNEALRIEADRIKDENQAAMKTARDNLTNARTNGNQESIIAAQKAVYLRQAEELKQFYSFLINQNLYRTVDFRATSIDLKTWNIQIIDEYEVRDPSNGEINRNSANNIAITINSNAINRLSRTNFRRMLSKIADPLSNPWNDPERDHGNPNGGVLGYDLDPYTSIKLVQQMLIVFGIMLLALIVYIIIRFKWTYYVALALGLILTFAAVVALTILFRIPISVELLSGFALLISFVLITMILVLGKGKAILSVDNKKTLMDKFAPELNESIKIREKRRSLDDKVTPLKKELKTLKKQLKKLKKEQRKNHEDHFDEINELNLSLKTLKKEIKSIKKENAQEFKAFKKATKANIHLLSRKNFFFKEIYMDLIKFTFKRILTLGIFYLLTAIILLTTLAPMFGMGLIVFIGIVVGFVVTLFVIIPLWIMLERYRLRNVSGFNVFMNNTKVSQEEQIVVDVND